jgi:hypothetical protein
MGKKQGKRLCSRPCARIMVGLSSGVTPRKQFLFPAKWYTWDVAQVAKNMPFPDLLELSNMLVRLIYLFNLLFVSRD